MEKAFLTIGTNTIKEELMRAISDDLLSNSTYRKNPKPSGGLWLSDYNLDTPNINLWLDYITSLRSQQEDPVYNEKYFGKHIIPAAVVVLKNDAKIFVLDNAEKLDELMKRYPHDKGLFSYKKLANDYDGIYIDYNMINVDYGYFKSFCVSSLLLFNTKPIDYYYEAQVEIKSLEQDYNGTIIPENYSITRSNEKKYINNVDNYYNKLLEELANIVSQHWFDNKDSYTDDEKREYFLEIYDKVHKYIKDNYAQNLNNDADEINKMSYTITHNLLQKK